MWRALLLRKYQDCRRRRKIAEGNSTANLDFDNFEASLRVRWHLVYFVRTVLSMVAFSRSVGVELDSETDCKTVGSLYFNLWTPTKSRHLMMSLTHLFNVNYTLILDL